MISNLFPTKHILRKITTTGQNVYLTFDDGPSDLTPAVLDLLKKYHFTATFFVIGDKAFQHKKLIHRMREEGHAIYSHSDDHDYSKYFSSEKTVGDWIVRSIQKLQSLTNSPNLYFRPPAGIVTPPLLRATYQKNIQIILWSQRFYDSTWKLTPRKIKNYLEKIKSGDIILLHDAQKSKNADSFMASLDYLLLELTNKGYRSLSLT